jgi:hypothetical protein
LGRWLVRRRIAAGADVGVAPAQIELVDHAAPPFGDAAARGKPRSSITPRRPSATLPPEGKPRSSITAAIARTA